MATITLQGNPFETVGSLPEVGSEAPDFQLTKSDLSDVSKADFAGKKVVLNIFPSVDTGICQASVRAFNEKLSSVENTVVLCVSKDLPFAHKRFCDAEGLSNVIPASEYKNHGFSSNYAVAIAAGPFGGLFSRAVVIIDEAGKVVYTEQVPEIAQEPDYDAAMAALV